MKTKDRLFIFLMVLLICLFWLFAMHEFAKNRNLNWINVTWSAEDYVSADWALVTVEFYATWDSYNQRDALLKERANQVKEIFTWYKLNSIEWGYEMYEDEWCYVKNRRLWVVCMKQYLGFEITWNIEEKANVIQEKLNEFDWVNVWNWNIAVQENWEAINQIRGLANQNAREKAEWLAKSLWVKLWKLLVYSENWFDGNGYYNNLQNRIMYYSQFPSSFDIKLKATVYHTYAIK